MFETLIGKGVIVPLPGEAGFDISLRGQRLHRRDNVQVLHIEIFMFRCVEVLLRDQDTLYTIKDTQS